MTKSEPLPTWLDLPPDDRVPPPVQTAEQMLPFDKLAWENLERLCLRLARRRGDIEDCRLYGNPGDEQRGIDLYGRVRGQEKKIVYQSKRVRNFTAGRIIATFDAFIDGGLADETAEFVLCTSESLRGADRDDEWNRQRQRAALLQIAATRWDAEELILMLKDEPEIVFDFFGPAWFQRFFLREPTEFAHRLTPEEMSDFRSRCRDFYGHVFDQADPGLPLGRGADSYRLSLPRRYVVPDIEEERAINTEERPPNEGQRRLSAAEIGTNVTTASFGQIRTAAQAVSRPKSVQLRSAVDEWLAQAPQMVVLGDPGAGKSSLLRFIALDLLEAAPTLPKIARQWGCHLPVWVPFPFWTSQVARDEGASPSLSEVLRRWFERYDRADLLPLVRRALDDRRLLLLVDGLDEWRDEAAARIVLDQLVVFIRDRQVPAVLVSRPQGFERLRGSIPGWPTGTLAKLSPAQQERFATVWFTEDCRRQLQLEESGIAAAAKTRSENFLRDLRAMPDLAELSTVPLLFSLLLRLSIERLELPRNRFEAYDRMIDLLLEYHPQSRRAASQVLEKSFAAEEVRFGPDDLKDAFAALAWRLHVDGAEGSVDEATASQWLETYLADAQGMGVSPSAARSAARVLLGRAEAEYGLFVAKGPRRLGFFHRTCQEALASRHLGSFTSEKQAEALRKYAADPHWREVLLAFLHRQPKPQMRAHLQTIRALQEAGDDVTRCRVERLLAEVAFGEARLYPEDHELLIRATFKVIERGDYPPQREALLRTALGALRAQSYLPRQAVQGRAIRWFPAFAQDRARTLREMARWPRSAELQDALILNLHDEEPVNARAAAGGLVSLYAGDEATGRELASLSRSSANVITRACALEALHAGWPNNSELPQLLELNRECGSGAPTVAAVRILVERGEQVADDRDRLLLHSHRGIALTIPQEWEEDLVLTLVRGWPKDAVIRAAALEGCAGSILSEESVNDDIAFPILLFGYPGDDEVAEALLGALNAEYSHFGWRHLPDRPNLAQWAAAWRGHRVLEPGVEAWLRKHGNKYGYGAIDIYHFAQTDGIRRWMLECLATKQSLAGFALHVLLRLWGMNDPDTGAAIRRYVAEYPHGYAEAQDEVLAVAEDRGAARQQSLASLQSEDQIASRQALMALNALDGHLASDDVVAACLSLADKSESWREHFLWNLIAYGSRHPSVRSLAKDNLNAFDRTDAAFACGFGDDRDIRNALLERAAPLPKDLRVIVATSLEGSATEDLFPDELLGRYRSDREPEVTTAAAISLARRDVQKRTSISDLAAVFTADLRRDGSGYHQLRLAALAGLLASRRYDLIPSERRESKDLLDQAMDWWTLSRAPAFQQLLVEHWTEFERDLGDAKLTEILRMEDRERHLHLFTEVPPGSAVARWAADYSMRTAKNWPRIEDDLRLLAAAYPRSDTLRDACLRILHEAPATTKHDSQLIIGAAKVLGDVFRGDDTTREALLSNTRPEDWGEGVIVALCRGWPENEQLKGWLDHAAATKKEATFASYWHVVACLGSEKRLSEDLRRLEKPHRQDERLAIADAGPVFIARVRRDEEIAEWLVREIKSGASTSLAITALWALRQAGVQSVALDEWLSAKSEEFAAADASTRFGRNIFQNTEEALSHVILHHLL